MTLKKIIERWRLAGKPYDQGLEILDAYSRITPNIKRILYSPRRTRRQSQRLEWELTKLERTQGSFAPPTVSAKKSIVQRIAEEPPKSKKEQILQEVIGSIPEPKTVEDLTRDIRYQYQKRRKLSNQLEPDGGDPKIIEKNKQLIDELKPIMAEMKDLEERKRQLDSGELKPETKTVVIRTKHGKNQLSMDELIHMSLDQLKKIEAAIKVDMFYRKKSIRTAKKAKTKEKSRQTLQKLQVMQKLILRMISEKM